MSEHVGVAASGYSAAFFDLDRTLIAGSSSFALAASARSLALITTHDLLRDAVAAIAFKIRGADDETSANARDRMLQFVTGKRHDDLVAVNELVLPALLGKIRPEAHRLVEHHRNQGRATYIVSAAPREVVEPLALALGMTAGIGTVAVLADGVYTGELSGPFCYGEGKLEAIANLAKWEGFDLDQCYAYSDSSSDLPMLTAVGHPVAVNPDGKLERHARAQGWPVVIFSERTKTVIRRSVTGAASTAFAIATFAVGREYGARRARRTLVA